MSEHLETDAHLLAGSGRAEIRIPSDAFPLDGFTGLHDPLHVRALLLQDDAHRTVILSVELTSIPDDTVDQLRAVVAEITGASQSAVVVAATHTFSAPHLAPGSALLDRDGTVGPLARALVEATREALSAASATLRPATVGTGTAIARIAVNRDVPTAHGWWLGADDGGPADPEISVVRIDDQQAHPIAILLSAAVQSSVMNDALETDGGRLVGADIAGAAAKHVEHEYGDGAVVLFLTGAAGDQAPYLTAKHASIDRFGTMTTADLGSAGHVIVDLLGGRLGAAAVHASEAVVPCTVRTVTVEQRAVQVPGQVAPRSFRDLAPSRDYDFIADGEQSVPFWLIRLGTVVVVGLRAELSSATGRVIKDASTSSSTLIATMVNGGAKYLPDRTAYDRRTYEAMSARYARGSAEIVSAAIIAELTDSSGHPPIDAPDLRASNR